MIGTILGNRYEVFYHLGGGGFGQTYLAKDTTVPESQWCLIKQLKPTSNPLYVSNLSKAQQLFDREIEVLKGLGHHDRIPSLLDFFTETKERYIVQEFVDGHELSKELEENPKFSEAQILIFLKSILEVLDFVHSREYIHRDINPSNLIRRRQDKQFVLIDFGAVKQIASAIESIGETGTRIGTNAYMSREQERGRPKLCSDIYSLGIVAVQAFIGSLPSIDEDTNEVDWQRQRQASVDFANLLNKMICERPIDRYASAAVALEEVNKTISQLEPKIIEEAINQPTPCKFDYSDYWYTEANTLKNVYGYHRQAIYLYDKAIEIQPHHWKAWFNRGITLRYLVRYTESAKSFEVAIEINSKLPKLHFQKGWSLMADGNFLAALNSYNLAIQLAPFYSPAWLHKGIALYKLERYDEASEAYDEAKRLRPSFARTNSPSIL